jgi:GalNAc-alpha-(1->4)-GalNAc-alpha-(1->3)-diNAcBac-PP-undecaprenol alpha-1,4-N-acetyl-D-galactosaminyltransferase
MVLLANKFTDLNHEVSIITFNQGQFYDLHPKINSVDLHRGLIKNHTIRSFLNLFSLYLKKKNRPDVAIALMPRMSLISIIACKLFGIKVIGCEHNNHLRKVEKWTKFTWNYIYRFADKITVLTEFDRDFFERKKAKVLVMPNPCTFDILKNNDHKREKTILAVGGLDRYIVKGFDNLLNLIVPVLKNNPDWSLKIAGGGATGLHILNEIVIAHQLNNQVEFLGFVSNINTIMKKSEIFCLPSRREGLPMVLLEAMSQGMTCIAYNCKTGPSEIISHKKNGLLIEDQNHKEMQNGLEFLMNNDEIRKRYSTNAIKNLNRFSMNTIIGKWNDLFKELNLL